MSKSWFQSSSRISQHQGLHQVPKIKGEVHDLSALFKVGHFWWKSRETVHWYLTLSLVYYTKCRSSSCGIEPQNRVYAGVVQSDGGLGGTVSIESRLTQLITINMGGFVSTPSPLW